MESMIPYTKFKKVVNDSKTFFSCIHLWIFIMEWDNLGFKCNFFFDFIIILIHQIWSFIISNFSLHYHNWNLNIHNSKTLSTKLFSHIHMPKFEFTWKHFKENFIIFFPFSIMHPSSRLHQERTSKKTQCCCQYINIQIIIYIGFTIQWKLFNFFTRLPSNNFKSSRKNKKKQELTWGEPSHH